MYKMLIKSTLLFILVFFNTTIFAQLQTGIKGGYALLGFSDWNDYGTDVYSNTKPSYYISFFLRQRKPRCFNFSWELEYSHRYFSVNSKWGYTPYSYFFDNLDISAQYAKVSLVPQFTFGKGVIFFYCPCIYF